MDSSVAYVSVLACSTAVDACRYRSVHIPQLSGLGFSGYTIHTISIALLSNIGRFLEVWGMSSDWSSRNKGCLELHAELSGGQIYPPTNVLWTDKLQVTLEHLLDHFRQWPPNLIVGHWRYDCISIERPGWCQDAERRWGITIHQGFGIFPIRVYFPLNRLIGPNSLIVRSPFLRNYLLSTSFIWCLFKHYSGCI